jgi:transcriptional regulator with XRE-family HTH domain
MGLTAQGRRRAPGLRREEVAALAGVSTVWYTWLEQGRDVRPSTSTIARIAAALNLRDDEKRYLVSLLQSKSAHSSRIPAQDLSLIRAMVNGVSQYSAFARNSLWDLLCWNERYEYVFGNWMASAQTNNLLNALFLNKAFRSRIENLSEATSQALERFRIDYGQHSNDVRYQALVNNLKRDSAEFVVLWDCHHVRRVAEKTIEVRTSNKELISLDRISLHPSSSDDITVVVHIPASGIPAETS